MYLSVSIIVALTYIVLTAFQVAYVVSYRRKMANSNLWNTETAGYSPHAAVVLCLRGADPSLEDCLQGLAQQRYQNFQLYCVFDHPNDPAWAVVDTYRNDFESPPEMLLIDPISMDRSLKCSALLTAFSKIEARNQADTSKNQVVALVDADTICDRNWLSDLIAPLQQPLVGATTGNRWFNPQDHAMGSRVRKYWNAAAIVQMMLYRVAWGGSLAFRTELLSRTRWRKSIETMFCEDTAITAALHESGLKLCRVEHLILNNTESTTIPSATKFIARQLFNMRMYHNAWWLVVGHALMMSVLHVAAIALAVFAFFNQSLVSGAIGLTAFLLFQVFNYWLLEWIERANLEVLSGRISPDTTRRPNQDKGVVVMGRKVAAMLLTQCVHPLAVVRAATTRRMDWRGVSYRVKPRGKIEMLCYIPFQRERWSDQSVE